MYGVKEFCWVDTGIELSLLDGRDSGNESEVVVDGNELGFPRSLNILLLGKLG